MLNSYYNIASRFRYRIWLSGRFLLPIFAAMVLGIAAVTLPVELAASLFAVTLLALLVYLEPVGGIVVLLLVAPLKTLIETEAIYTLPIDVGQVTLLAAFGLWLLRYSNRRERLYLRTSIVQAPLFLFAFVAALSLPGALSLGAGLTELSKWLEVLFLVSFCLMVCHRFEAHWLVFGVILSGGVQATLGIYEFLGGSGAEHLRILDGRCFRAFGSFGQPNPFGAFMGITLAMALGAIWGYLLEIRQHMTESLAPWHKALRHKTIRVAVLSCVSYILMAGLISIGLLVSWSRGAWIGFAVAAMTMLFFVPRTFAIRMVLIIVVLVLVVVVWSSGLIPDTLVQRMGGFAEELTTIEDVRGVDITDSNFAVVERIAHWQVAVMMAKDHPWLGVGFGNYEAVYPQYALLNWPYPLGHAHNYYLNLLAEVGILGLAAYLIAWSAIFVLTVKYWRGSEGLTRGWSIGLIGVWTYLAAHSFLDKLYVNNMFLHLGCMLGLLAILLGTSSQQRDRS